MCLCLFVCRRLILCRVTLGKPVEQVTSIRIAHAPPGHHSVIGRPSAGGLNHPEYVIYRGEQVCIEVIYLLLFFIYCLFLIFFPFIYLYIIIIIKFGINPSELVNFMPEVTAMIFVFIYDTNVVIVGISRVLDHLHNRKARRDHWQVCLAYHVLHSVIHRPHPLTDHWTSIYMLSYYL